MKLKPLGDRIVVKKIKEENVTKSGIVLADSKKKKEVSKGTVTAVNESDEIKVGDTVLFVEEYGTVIDEHIILEVQDVLAII